MNFYTMDLSDLRYELDKFRRFIERFGASEKQERYLKAMENAYIKRMNKQYNKQYKQWRTK